MPIVRVTQGDNQDGCGPYGRHLTGAVDWQKRYQLTPRITAATSAILVANRDYLMPIPPPSEDITLESMRAYISTAGTTSFIRMGILDAENMAALTRVVDAGEIASDSGGAFVELAIAPTVLRRNGRYLSLICGRGAVLCKPQKTSAYSIVPNWLGDSAGDPSSSIGLLLYVRANAPIPAIYDGVYNSNDLTAYSLDGKLA
jgi:hypothetical protein